MQDWNENQFKTSIPLSYGIYPSPFQTQMKKAGVIGYLPARLRTAMLSWSPFRQEEALNAPQI